MLGLTLKLGFVRFVVANRTGPNGTVVAPWVFRSYEMRHDASRANRGGRPGDICVWQVARATTAAPMYFKPYELKTHGNLDGLMGRPPFHRDTTMNIEARSLQGNVNSTGHKETTGPPVVRLEDGGFGTANNPAKYMLDELKEQLPEGVRVGTFVSVGTARPRETAKGPPLLRLIKGAIHRLGDPEGTHEYMMRQATDPNAPLSYYRLNSPGEPSGVEMDDWKPRATGEDTMERMKIAFNHYFVQPEVSDLFRTCAEKLVEARRARVRANRPKWDRFALGRHFYCKKEWNCHDEVQREINEVRFRAHLKDAHGMRNEDIDDAVNGCKHQWNYRGLAVPKNGLL
ncbi:uncharacterized protein F4807DRAFT_455325 [Annulohypoxylon truncatum]|uniref:uncharacterized protein n=1 Tax=Annulohypoxylon truncatum TaxID=327061 RepID=UPI0020085352|nr:uncharacterized protein F4807DRAFT_455325 [Annulohypoxylon truncatum]KAI1214874.1 hypothetical protein F4807DRAFT_455325 [Annulohypoxylon truncatum]